MNEKKNQQANGIWKWEKENLQYHEEKSGATAQAAKALAHREKMLD